MERILFDNVVPEVFSQQGSLGSDVWQQSLALEKGRTYLLEADSGKGKSTFCSYLIGYRNDYSGTITFDGRDVRTLAVGEWAMVRQRHLSHLFQELRLFPELTALENVTIKNQMTHWKSEEQITAYFERLGLADKLHAKIGRMSFGQQQRVALIRALVQPFDFLIVDEPISHLDDTNAAIMGEMMMEEVRSQGAGFVVMSIGKHMDLPYDKVFRL